MFIEDINVIPEDLRDQFIEVEIDGKKGYQDKDSHELRSHLYNIKNENKSVKDKLSAFEQKKQEEIEQARREAMEEAKSKGDIDKITAHYESELKKLRDESDAFRQTYNETRKQAAINELLSVATEQGKSAFKMLLSNQIKFDETGENLLFLTNDGGAVKFDAKNVADLIKKDDVFKPLVKADQPTIGGGLISGATRSGASTERKFNEYTGSELSELRQKDPALYDRLKKSFYDN